MVRCMYSGKDETSASFEKVEHIFPKCIGGVRCLPKGWVCDEVNQSFSGMELRFARENPGVTISRMFFAPTGRKKHKKRERIGVFRKEGNEEELMLGYIKNGTPIPLEQLSFSLQEAPEEKPFPVRVIVPPHSGVPREEQIRGFFARLKDYSGQPVCIRDSQIPEKTYLLGCSDQQWFLGLSAAEEFDRARESVWKVVNRVVLADVGDTLLRGNEIKQDSHQVKVSFSFSVNYLDCLRIYAKIAMNCLAALKGYGFATDQAFDGLKRAVLTGEGIEEHVWSMHEENLFPTLFSKYFTDIQLGKHHHATVFVQKDRCVYGVVFLFGAGAPMAVKMGTVQARVDPDFYVCDWENHKDYTMTECVLKVCGYQEIR